MHYIQKSQLGKDYDRGGLQAVDFESLVGAFRINWLKLSNPSSMWYHIPNSQFNQLGLEILMKYDFILIINYL
jgi:hypothetical protein